MRTPIVGLLVATFVGTVLASSAVATTPQSVTITETRSSLMRPGSFVLSGAFSDVGSSTIDEARQTAFASPVVGTGHFTATFHGAQGSITVLLQTLLTPTEVPWILHEDGNWVLAGGTGTYASLHGQGSFTATLNLLASRATAVYTGEVH